MVRHANDEVNAVIVGLATSPDIPGNLYIANAADNIEFRRFNSKGSGQLVVGGDEWQGQIVAQVTEAKLGPYGDLWVTGDQNDRVLASELGKIKWRITCMLPYGADDLPLNTARMQRMFLGKNLADLQLKAMAGMALPKKRSVLIRPGANGYATITLIGGKYWRGPGINDNGEDNDNEDLSGFFGIANQEAEADFVVFVNSDGEEVPSPLTPIAPSLVAVNGIFQPFSLADWKDPDERFIRIKDKEKFELTCEPPILDSDNIPIHPCKYEAAIPPGTWVQADVKMRKWVMRGDNGEITAIHNQLIVVSMKVLQRGLTDDDEGLASNSGSSPSTSGYKRKSDSSPPTPARVRTLFTPVSSATSTSAKCDTQEDDDILAPPESPTQRPTKKGRFSKKGKGREE